MKWQFTVSKGFLSIYALIVFIIVASVMTYANLIITSQKQIQASEIYEDIFALKVVQRYYEDQCEIRESNLVDEDEDDEVEELQPYTFHSSQHSYELDFDGFLYKDTIKYMQFQVNEEQCIYTSYSHIDE